MTATCPRSARRTQAVHRPVDNGCIGPAAELVGLFMRFSAVATADKRMSPRWTGDSAPYPGATVWQTASTLLPSGSRTKAP